MSAAQRKPAESPYQSLFYRIQRVIASPAAQANRSACLYRSPDENESLWDQLIDELSQAEAVHTERIDGGVRVTWDSVTED